MARLYKNINVWHLGYGFVLKIYKLTEKFPKEEINNLISQMRRAATSIPLNIAEGSTKRSHKEFLNFLSYAYGSAKELEVLLMLSKDLKYITNDEYEKAEKELDSLMAKLFLFISNIEKRINDKKYNFFRKFKSE